MASSNILSLPFRKSTPISLASAIQQGISIKYNQHPDLFRGDLEVIDKLRRDAINVREPHMSGISRLQTYAGQLAWMEGKFPVDIGAAFTWYPALGYHTERPHVEGKLKYELMNILYNLAALFSQLAVAKNRSNPEELKSAANQFALAAGVLQHIRTKILPETSMDNPPDDMDEATLDSLEQLCLAQSQECFWHKAVMDKYKDSSIAKLATRVSDLYKLASEVAVRSEAISSAWIHHMSAKHHHFAAAAQYRAACDCLEKRRYGEEVARLADSLACVKEGLKECKGNSLSKAVVEDLNGLKKRVEEDLKRAEKDNDVIYLQPVPAKSELKTLERANMAVVRVPPQVADPFEYLGDHKEFGPALFTKLVPYSVHVAISAYESRRDGKVNNDIISQIESLTAKMHEDLSSLNIPGSLQALEKPLGLPGTLKQHAEEIRQADGPNRLLSGFADVEMLRSNDRAVFEEGKALLAAEEDEDMRLRRQYGTHKWVRPESRLDGAKRWKTAADIDGYFASSTSSDGVVRDKFEQVRDLLAVLAGSDRDLLDYIPNSRGTGVPEMLKPALGRLRSAYNDAQRLESRRRKLMEDWRARARSDDVRADMLKEAARLERMYPTTAIVPTHFDDFFDRRLQCLYDDDFPEIMSKEVVDQERVLAAIHRANRDFEAQQKVVGDRGDRERELVLQKLDNAYFKYKEIVSNLEVGRKFYNDLSKIVRSFRDDARAWVNERMKDARSLEDEICMPPLAQLSISSPLEQVPVAQPAAISYRVAPPPATIPSYYNGQSPSPAQPQPHHPPEDARIQSWAENMAHQHKSHPKPDTPGVWTQGMDIKFAPARSGAGQPGGVEQENSRPQGTWEPGQGIRFG